MNHGSQVFEDLIDIPNISLQLSDSPLPLMQLLQALLLLHHNLGLALPPLSSLNINEIVISRRLADASMVLVFLDGIFLLLGS